VQRKTISAALAFCAMTLAACNQKEAAPVTDATVRLPAVAGNPGAAYFTLHGDEKDGRLISISSPQAGRTEMHDVKMEGGMMTMTPIDNGLAIPKGATIKFETGGRHAMLFDMKPGLKAGDKVTLTFTYSDGHKVSVDATGEAPGGGHGH
jgi:copper(I)-binding protein